MARTGTEFNRNLRELEGKIFKSGVTREILRESEATWVVKPVDGRVLDIAFKPKRAKRGEFAGVPIFQRPNCIGVVFCEEGEREGIWQGLQLDRQLTALIDDGAEVVVMTPNEFESWEGFYKQVVDEGVLAKVGEKALNFSGLRRLMPKEHEMLLADAGGFFTGEIESWLKQMKVKEVAVEGLGQIDVAFLDRKGDRMVVPVSHVRVGEMQGEILVEKVISEQVWVPGVIMRRAGENKREAYQRANNLKRYYKNRFGEGYKVEFPVISPGQLSLWRKLGIGGPLEASLPEVGITAEEVIRFLYLGESNIAPGQFVDMDLSMPGGGGEFPGLDIVFYKRDGYGNRQFVAVDGLMGLDLQQKKLGREGLEGLGNVRGIVIIPDGWSAKEMREHTKLILKDFNYRTRGAGGFLLYLTPSLFAEWKANGSAFLGENGENGKSLERKVEYGVGLQGVDEISLRVIRLKPEIGNQKSAVVETKNGDSVWHLIDWGLSFAGSRALQEITAQEPTAIGIRRSLEVGSLPMVPGIYDIEHILASIMSNYKVGYAATADPVTSFLRAELVRRSSFNEAKRVAGSKVAKGVFKYGVIDESRWYKGNQQVVGSTSGTHGHVDHIGMMAYLYRYSKFFGSAETIVQIQARSAKGTWRSSADKTTLVTQPKKGSAYQVVHREMQPIYWNGQEVNLSPNLTARFYFVDHSMGGTTMVGVHEAGSGRGLMLYTADLKPGEQTSRAVEMAAGKYEVVMMECTNVEDGFKPSTGITEETVRDTLWKLAKQSGNDTLVAIIPPNHMRRLETIMEVAEGLGRVVAIDPSIAEVVEQLRVEKEMMAPLGADGFNEYLPRLGEEVALWWPPVTAPKSYRKILAEKAESGPLGVVNGERLSRQGSKLMVVTTPYRLLRHDFGGASFRHGLEVFYMSFYPYQDSAKYRLGESLAWVNMVDREQIRGSNRARMFVDFGMHGQGGRVDPYNANYKVRGKKQGLHASGHATFGQLVEIANALGGRINVLVHGDKPVNFAAGLQKRLGKGVEIISKLDRYDPADPIERPGFKLRLD
jgi:hypothetical protein